MLKRLCTLVCLLLVACGQVGPLPTLQPTAVLPTTPFNLNVQPIPATNTAVSEGTVISTSDPIYSRVRLSADTAVPPELLAAAQKIAQQNLAQYTWVEPAEADVRLVVGDGELLATWVYAVAASFATVPDGLTFAELQANWQGTTPGPPILVAASTLAAMAPVLGQPGPAVQVVAQEELVAQTWAQPSSLTILPFDELTPELKVLQLDGRSPLAHEFDANVYPLMAKVGVVGEGTAVTPFLTLWNGPATNRDPQKLTRIAITGVTALVRATAFNMEQSGILWPGEEVGPVLRTADIAHISNEVSFAPDCPYPNPIGGTTFCSSDAYFALIQDLGADVIELTGNHLNDWGRENMVRTMEMYETAGMQTFGGGRNLAEAAQPALFEHNGNRIAFVGCNSFGPEFAWATENATGSMPCDGSLPGQISQLRNDGYLVLATLQYTEFYHYPPTPQQEVDFKALAEAGATAVSGSQGHHAQAFAFHNGAFIHYGLGNLFFDQMDMLGTRQSFVDTYVVYDGRLLNVELWTGLIENYARPRQMTAEERREALTTLFQASGWGNQVTE
jgi:poly-gamma-glutamate synthesis protein (capsule biosynthesis protein)